MAGRTDHNDMYRRGFPVGAVRLVSAHGTFLHFGPSGIFGGRRIVASRAAGEFRWVVTPYGPPGPEVLRVTMGFGTGQYLRGDSSGSVNTATRVQEWELWSIETHPTVPNRYAIRSHHNTYLRCDNNGITVNLSQNALAWEAWDIRGLPTTPDPLCGVSRLHSQSGYFLKAATSRLPQGDHLWSRESYGPSFVAFRANDGTYLCDCGDLVGVFGGGGGGPTTVDAMGGMPLLARTVPGPVTVSELWLIDIAVSPTSVPVTRYRSRLNAAMHLYWGSPPPPPNSSESTGSSISARLPPPPSPGYAQPLQHHYQHHQHPLLASPTTTPAPTMGSPSASSHAQVWQEAAGGLTPMDDGPTVLSALGVSDSEQQHFLARSGSELIERQESSDWWSTVSSFRMEGGSANNRAPSSSVAVVPRSELGNNRQQQPPQPQQHHQQQQQHVQRPPIEAVEVLAPLELSSPPATVVRNRPPSQSSPLQSPPYLAPVTTNSGGSPLVPNSTTTTSTNSGMYHHHVNSGMSSSDLAAMAAIPSSPSVEEDAFSEVVVGAAAVVDLLAGGEVGEVHIISASSGQYLTANMSQVYCCSEPYKWQIELLHRQSSSNPPATQYTIRTCRDEWEDGGCGSYVQFEPRNGVVSMRDCILDSPAAQANSGATWMVRPLQHRPLPATTTNVGSNGETYVIQSSLLNALSSSSSSSSFSSASSLETSGRCLNCVRQGGLGNSRVGVSLVEFGGRSASQTARPQQQQSLSLSHQWFIAPVVPPSS